MIFLSPTFQKKSPSGAGAFNEDEVVEFVEIPLVVEERPDAAPGPSLWQPVLEEIEEDREPEAGDRHDERRPDHPSGKSWWPSCNGTTWPRSRGVMAEEVRRENRARQHCAMPPARTAAQASPTAIHAQALNHQPVWYWP